MNSYKRDFNRNGISLTEILIVVFIAAVALIPIFGLLSNNARQVSFNQDRAVAQILAVQVLERFKHETFDELRTNFSTYEAGANYIANDDVLVQLMFDLPEKTEALYRKFTREAIFIEEVPNHFGQLSCKVTWKNNQRQDRGFTWSIKIRNVDFQYGKP